MNELADRFFAAVSAGDEAALTELYDPDARIWHNDKNAEETVTENLRVLRWLSRTLENMRYEDIRRYPLPQGFAQQHVLRGEIPGHGPLDVPASMFVEVRAGRIVRIDEYVDSAATLPLRELATRKQR
ncbi:nuclear transport factor 2 family protein [Nocardia sp. NPDC003963]